eukprot:71703-Chlamydomonas_euryale.AAC.1
MTPSRDAAVQRTPPIQSRRRRRRLFVAPPTALATPLLRARCCQSRHRRWLGRRHQAVAPTSRGSPPRLAVPAGASQATLPAGRAEA